MKLDRSKLEDLQLVLRARNGGDRAVTITVPIPETVEEADRRRQGALATLRAFREEGDEAEQAETLDVIRKGLGPRHFPEAKLES